MWGGYLNDNWTSIDSLLFTATNKVKRVVTAVDTATIADRNKILLGDATIATYVQTLPSAATVGNGFEISFTKTDATAHTIAVTRAGTDTIGGSTSAYILSSQNDFVTLISDGVSNWNYQTKTTTVSDSTTSVKGITRYATNAEAIAKTLTTAALTPSNLAAVLDTTTTASGYTTIGGIIFQWGNTSTKDENVITTTTFPLVFPASCLAVVGIPNTHIATASAPAAITAFTATGFTWQNGGGGGGSLRGLRWLAIGK